MPRYTEVNWEVGACKGAPTNLFYVVEEDRSVNKYIDVGILRTMCGGCPIYKSCLSYALEHENYGVWGGMTTQERNAFNGRAPYRETTKIIIELANYGVSITDITEAVNEYQDNV